jgi:hypothetical protein
MTEPKKLTALLGQLQHETGPELSDTIEEILKTSHSLDQVVNLVERKIETGAYVRDDPLTSLIIRSGSSKLYAKVRDRLFNNDWTLLALYRARYPDTEIENTLCGRLYAVASNDAEPRRRYIVDAMREVASEAVLPTLEAILFRLEPSAKVRKTFAASLGYVEALEASSRADFVKLVSLAIDEIRSRAGTAPTDTSFFPSEGIALLVEAREGRNVEFKSTFRWDLRQDKKNDAITHASLKTIAAFLNTDGGTLLIGVADDKSAVGIEADGFQNEDKFLLHFYAAIKASMGIEATTLVQADIDMYKGKKVCIVRCKASPRPVYIRAGGKDEEFFIRTGPSSERLGPSDLVRYISEHKHFKGSLAAAAEHAPR